MCFSRKVSSKRRAALQKVFERQVASKGKSPPKVPSSTISQSTAHHIVQHDYHDHSHDDIDETKLSKQFVARGGVTTPFPIKLHQMLDRIEADGHAHIISWAPHGRCFVVHKPKDFVDVVLHKYFNQSKFASFQRQLNLYGFNRLTRGADKNGYYHELFLRNKPLLAHKIQRFKVKGTGVRARSNPDHEPNFYAMEPLDNDGADSQMRTMDGGTPPLPVTSFSAPDIIPSTPLEIDPLPKENEVLNDDLLTVFGMQFHSISPKEFHRRHGKPHEACEAEMKNFLKNLNFSRNVYDQIIESSVDGDEEFGQLLETIVDL